MKISKVAATTARRLFGLCQTGGRLDDAKLRTVVSPVWSKPSRATTPAFSPPSSA